MTTPTREQELETTFTVVFTVLTMLWLWFDHRTGLALFRSLAALGTWAALAAFLPAVPVLPFRLRPLVLASGASLPLFLLFLPRAKAIGGATDQTLQFASVLLAIAAFGLHFFATYGSQIKPTETKGRAQNLVGFARLLAIGHASCAAVFLVRNYTEQSWFSPVQIALSVITLGLMAESLTRVVFHFYQPARLRSARIPFGESVLLNTLFERTTPFRALGAMLQKTYGVQLGETWLVRLARALVTPLMLIGLLGAWGSTAVTRVPVDSEGVLVTQGEFQDVPLAPGLHFHAPWPWGRVELVPTTRVQELSLGFGRDLAGPVLWTEKHFEEEQNLLMGQGEELLTVNVPVHFRIRDAVAFARRTSSPQAALTALGYRQLLRITGEHTSFGLMTSDRATVADQLRNGLQQASDQLGLGLEILFVGLKDVHPPVSVASAYQDVVSAEEEQLTQIDQARSYSVQSLGAAQVSAHLTRLNATTVATERSLRAAGETSRFLAPLATFRDYREVFSSRLHLEALEEALAQVRQLYVVPAGSGSHRNFILGSDHATAVAPLLK